MGTKDMEGDPGGCEHRAWRGMGAKSVEGDGAKNVEGDGAKGVEGDGDKRCRG